MIMKFYKFVSTEIRNTMKLESSDSELRSKINPYFKISKNPNKIWAKMTNKTTFKAKLTT